MSNTHDGRPDWAATAEAIDAVTERLRAFGLAAHANPIRAALQARIEELPIHQDEVHPGRTEGFVLSGGEWWPCSVIVEINHGVMRGGIQYRIDYTNGDVESGVVRRYHWAHATADDTVNYHWLDPVEEEDHANGEEETHDLGGEA